MPYRNVSDPSRRKGPMNWKDWFPIRVITLFLNDGYKRLATPEKGGRSSLLQYLRLPYFATDNAKRLQHVTCVRDRMNFARQLHDRHDSLCRA